MSKPNELMLIDLSSIAYPIWMTATNQPDPDFTSQQIVARVHALTSDHPHAALCCDSGKSFRHEATPSYKANRPERVEAMHHQIRLAKERLEADGFPIWAVRGFEADDLIASATGQALAIAEDVSVLIVSGDKDLFQLVSPRVRVMGATSGQVYDETGVKTKYAIAPDQMRDYLTLVGDSSDNVKGAEKIGPVKAAQLLALFGTLDAVYAAIDDESIRAQPAILASLKAFRPRLAEVRNLITLRTDVELPFHEISAERTPRDRGLLDAIEEMSMEDPNPQDTPAESATVTTKNQPQPTATSNDNGSTFTRVEQKAEPPTHALTLVNGEIAAPPPAEWERQLDPRSMKDAEVLSLRMFKSRMFSAYGTAEAVLSTIMLGRELGFPAMASLRSVHVIEGKHSLSAGAMRALVLRSGMAEYFEPVVFDDLKATFITKRVNGRREIELTHTIEMARRAFGFDVPMNDRDRQQAEIAWVKSGWGKNPEDMLVARATARLARMVYPDLLAGLYTPEELEEIRLQRAA